MSNLTNLLLGNLADLGFFELLLPWLLFFTLLYVIFKKLNTFEEESQNIVFSLAISLFIINFTTFGLSFAGFLTESFGYMAIGIVFILIAWVFCGMFGVDTTSLVNENKTIFFGIAALLALILFFKIFEVSLGNSDNLLITMFFILCIFGGIFYIAKT